MTSSSRPQSCPEKLVIQKKKRKQTTVSFLIQQRVFFFFLRWYVYNREKKYKLSSLQCSGDTLLICTLIIIFSWAMSQDTTPLLNPLPCMWATVFFLYLLLLYTEDMTPKEALQREALQTESVFQEHSFQVIRFQALSGHYRLQSQRQQLVHWECRSFQVLKDRNQTVQPLHMMQQTFHEITP